MVQEEELRLSRDELLALLSMMEVERASGLEPEPLADLDSTALRARAEVGMASLMGRGLLQLHGPDEGTLDKGALALVWAALVPVARSRLDLPGASGPTVVHTFTATPVDDVRRRRTPPLLVEHWAPAPDHYRFAMIAGPDALFGRAEALLHDLACRPFVHGAALRTLTDAALTAALAAGGTGERATIERALLAAGWPPAQAAALAIDLTEAGRLWCGHASWGLRQGAATGGEMVLIVGGRQRTWLATTSMGEADLWELRTAGGGECAQTLLGLLDRLVEDD